MNRIALLLACLAASACSHATPGESRTLSELRAIGRTAACSSDQQCKTVPVGAKSCGGPESYMAYSTANVSTEKALSLAARYRKEREAENQASGLVSDCRFMMDPGAQCRAGTCQLGGKNGALVE